ncbi:MAG: hypothetical protein ABIQ89_03385 [Candidatus Saccharimonadales bacterium]
MQENAPTEQEQQMFQPPDAAELAGNPDEMQAAVEAAAVRSVDPRSELQVQVDQQMNLSAAARKNAAAVGKVPTADLR